MSLGKKMYKIETHSDFSKDLKYILRSGVSINVIKDTVLLLEEYGELPSEYNTHILRYNYDYVYDSHIDDDLLLLWRKRGNTIKLLRIGTHADLFF